MKTPSGFETHGNFDLESDREQEMAIVEQFKGSDEKLENSILYMDLLKYNTRSYSLLSYYIVYWMILPTMSGS